MGWLSVETLNEPYVKRAEITLSYWQPTELQAILIICLLASAGFPLMMIILRVNDGQGFNTTTNTRP